MTTLQKIMNYNETMSAVNRKGDETVNLIYADIVVTLATTFDEYQLTEHGTTKRDNDGVDLNGYDFDGNVFPFVEVYNNSDTRSPNIAFRPHPSIRKKLGLTPDNNGIEGVKWSHPKHEKTDRFVIPVKSIVAFMDLLSERAIAYLDDVKRENAVELNRRINECRAVAGQEPIPVAQ